MHAAQILHPPSLEFGTWHCHGFKHAMIQESALCAARGGGGGKKGRAHLMVTRQRVRAPPGWALLVVMALGVAGMWVDFGGQRRDKGPAPASTCLGGAQRKSFLCSCSSPPRKAQRSTCHAPLPAAGTVVQTAVPFRSSWMRTFSVQYGSVWWRQPSFNASAMGWVNVQTPVSRNSTPPQACLPTGEGTCAYNLAA
jgi:hypothetical protein